jgi:CDP-diacylglycerol--glycerol-3-phosphate 3-phosphatidyltransferase
MSVPMNPANRVTILRMVFIPVFLVVMLGEIQPWVPTPDFWLTAQPWIAALLFTILAATDAVDGYLARSRNEVTTFGKLIDPLADKLLVTAALVALVDLDALPSWVALVIISREFIVTGLRMVAVAEGRVIAAGDFGKIKTVFQIIAIVMFIIKDSELIGEFASWAPSAFYFASWTVMSIALVLTIYSMIDYFYHAREVLTGPWRTDEPG